MKPSIFRRLGLGSARLASFTLVAPSSLCDFTTAMRPTALVDRFTAGAISTSACVVVSPTEIDWDAWTARTVNPEPSVETLAASIGCLDLPVDFHGCHSVHPLDAARSHRRRTTFAVTGEGVTFAMIWLRRTMF